VKDTDESKGCTVRVADLNVPFKNAVMVTGVATETSLVVIGKVALV
jgi:hypothetical protein